MQIFESYFGFRRITDKHVYPSTRIQQNAYTSVLSGIPDAMLYFAGSYNMHAVCLYHNIVGGM